MVLLKALPLEGRIITCDAIFTQREICAYIRDSNGIIYSRSRTTNAH